MYTNKSRPLFSDALLSRVKLSAQAFKVYSLSVYVRDTFRIRTWSLFRGLCFQVCNSCIRCSSAGGYQTALHCCGRPLLDWGWIACIRCKASCTKPRCPYRSLWNRWQYLLAKARPPWGRLTDMSNNQSQFVSLSVTFRCVEMSPQYQTGVWNSRKYFKDSMPQTSNISHNFENPAFSWSW